MVVECLSEIVRERARLWKWGSRSCGRKSTVNCDAQHQMPFIAVFSVMQYKYILSVCSTFQQPRTLSSHPFKAIMKMKSHGQTFVLQLQPKLQNEVHCVRFFCCHARMLPFKCQRRRRRLFPASSHCQQGTALAEQKIGWLVLPKLIHITGRWWGFSIPWVGLR